MVARTAPAVLELLADGVPRSRVAIIGTLSSFGNDGARCGTALTVEGPDGTADGGAEGIGVAEGAVGQAVPLQVAPGALDAVQLGGVPRQPLDP